jgi:hypothetical protein
MVVRLDTCQFSVKWLMNYDLLFTVSGVHWAMPKKETNVVFGGRNWFCKHKSSLI